MGPLFVPISHGLGGVFSAMLHYSISYCKSACLDSLAKSGQHTSRHVSGSFPQLWFGNYPVPHKQYIFRYLARLYKNEVYFLFRRFCSSFHSRYWERSIITSRICLRLANTMQIKFIRKFVSKYA